MTTHPILAARSLGWRSGEREILSSVDLDVARGECLAVVGPNGAGKTTLLRLLVALLSPSEGSLAWNGSDYRELSRRELARHIAYVPQIRPARAPLNVAQMILLGRYPYLSAWKSVPKESDFQAVRWAIDEVGLGQLEDRPMTKLSGGEQQAVYVAAALAQESELLVLDEPTTHLDPRHQRDVAALLMRLNKQHGKTVITATHDLNFASLIADRILALSAGRVLACDVPAKILCSEILTELFAAPFEIVRGGERPVTLLELNP